MKPIRFLIAASILTSPACLFAADIIKAGSGTDLTDGLSWATGIAPGTGDRAIWNNTSLVAGLTAATDVTWNTVLFGQTGSPLTGPLDITGTGKITLSATSGNIVVLDTTNAGQPVSISNDLVLAIGTGTAIAVGGNNPRGAITAASNITLGNVTALGTATANDANLMLRGASTGSVVNGVMTVDGQFYKGDTGTWTLNSANTLGWVFINNGTLRAGNDGAFGAGTIYLATGGGATTLASSSGTARTYANALDFSINASFGQTTGGTGAQTFNGAVNLGAAVRTITTNTNTTFAGVVSGAGGITKAGTANLTLSGTSANTYSGATTITGGTLFLGKTSGVNAVPGDVTATGGTLSWATGAADQMLDSASVTVSATGGLNGPVVDTFTSVTATGNAGRVNFGSGTNATLTGALSISGSNGAAAYNSYSLAANSANSTLTVGSLSLDNSYYGIGQGGANSATLTLNGGFTGVGTSTIAVAPTGGAGLNRLSLPAGNHNFNVTGTTTVNAAIIGAGGLTKQGTGTLVLSVAAGSGTGATTSYSGGTTLEAGTLQLDGTHAGAGGIFVNAGTLSGSGTVASPVVIGDGSGSLDAILTGGTDLSIGTFATTGVLDIASDGVFSFQLDSGLAAADRIVADGVTLAPSSAFSYTDISLSGFTLTPGSVFTIIENTSVGSIFGTFDGIVEGSVLTIGVNDFEFSYMGGTGNDVTLTVVPEPSAALSLLGGLGMLAFARRRR